MVGGGGMVALTLTFNAVTWMYHKTDKQNGAYQHEKNISALIYRIGNMNEKWVASNDG